MMNKWLLLASLYVAQFLPVGFFGQTIPVFLRQQGVSLELIGLTSLLGLPWMFNSSDNNSSDLHEKQKLEVIEACHQLLCKHNQGID